MWKKIILAILNHFKDKNSEYFLVLEKLTYCPKKSIEIKDIYNIEK
jgi:hypothetical protein